MATNNQTVFIAFSSQKGGVGKSTFTTLVSSILHYRLGYNVAVFDCDFPQHSLFNMRERDIKTVMQNEHHKKAAMKQFQSINKKAYPVIQCKAEEALAEAEKLMNTSYLAPDVILFDLPGTVNTPGVLRTLASVHHIFSPITADRVVLESTLSFNKVLVHQIMQSGQTLIKTVHLFWNQVDGREKSPLYEVYEKVIAELDLALMQTNVTDSKRFRKESEATLRTVFRSTLLPPDEKLMSACRLDMFMEEFLRIVKL